METIRNLKKVIEERKMRNYSPKTFVMDLLIALEVSVIVSVSVFLIIAWLVINAISSPVIDSITGVFRVFG